MIKKDSLRDQNWFAMIKIGSQCDGEIENQLAVVRKILCVIKIGSRSKLVLSVMGKWKTGLR